MYVVDGRGAGPLSLMYGAPAPTGVCVEQNQRFEDIDIPAL